MNTDTHSTTIKLIDSPIIQAGGSVSSALAREVGATCEALLMTAMKGTSESELIDSEIVLTLKLQPVTAPAAKA